MKYDNHSCIHNQRSHFLDFSLNLGSDDLGYLKTKNQGKNAAFLETEYNTKPRTKTWVETRQSKPKGQRVFLVSKFFVKLFTIYIQNMKLHFSRSLSVVFLRNRSTDFIETWNIISTYIMQENCKKKILKKFQLLFTAWSNSLRRVSCGAWLCLCLK